MTVIFHMYLKGFPAFFLLGSATAKIGDPTGRLTSRARLANVEYREFHMKIHYQLRDMAMNAEAIARRYGWERKWMHRRGTETNGVWWNKQSLLDIVSRFGNDLRMGPLLSRETFRRKMSEGDGLSVSEFLYPLMQAWDWWQMFLRLGVQVQIGGSDQYGNIITGMDVLKIIRDNEREESQRIPPGLLSDPVGFTVPLLTDASGQKLGKTADNAIWIDGRLTRPMDLYTYFMRQSDEKVGQLLKLITLVPTDQIEALMQEHMNDPAKRIAHHRLAFEVTWLCHGQQVAHDTQKRHVQLHGTKLEVKKLCSFTLPMTQQGNKVDQADVKLPMSILQTSVPRLLQAVGLAESTSDGRRIVDAGGAYIGASPGKKPQDQTPMPESIFHWTPLKDFAVLHFPKYIQEGNKLYVRKGKHSIRAVELLSDEEYDKTGLSYPGQQLKGQYRQLREALSETKSQLQQLREEGIEVDDEVGKLRADGMAESSVRTPKETTTRGEEGKKRHVTRDKILVPETSVQATMIRRMYQDTIRSLDRNKSSFKRSSTPRWVGRGNVRMRLHRQER